MHVVEVDERDSCWELEDARLRVYLFKGASLATQCYDITGAEVLDAEV